MMLTGYTRSELLKMTVWDLTSTPRRNSGLWLWRDFLRRGRMRGHYQVRRKEGTLVTTRYVAVANVLPGIHVSALSIDRSTRFGGAQRPRAQVTNSIERRASLRTAGLRRAPFTGA
jgi:hypothetical protein